MVDVLYPLIDFFCIIILAFLGFQNENYSNIGRKQIYFRFVIISVVVFCLVDAFWGLIASHQILDLSYVMFATSMYYICSMLVAGAWLRYLIGCTDFDKKIKHFKVFCSLILFPIFIYVVCILLNLKFKFIFDIQNHLYIKENTVLFVLLYAIQYFYFGFALILSVSSFFDKEKKGRIRTGVLYFSAVPILTGIMQIIRPIHPYDSFGYTLACFILFIFDVIVEREVAEGKTLELKQKQILDKCNQILSTNGMVEKNIETLLSLLCNYYDSNRVFILRYCEDNQDNMACDFEYCRLGVQSHIDELQLIPKEQSRIWTDRFTYQDGYHVSNVFDYVSGDPDLSEYFRKNNIISAIISPLRSAGKVFGLIGFDNPRVNIDDFSIVRTVSIYINSELLRQKQIEYEQKTNGAVLLTLAAEYSSVYYIDMKSDSVKPYRMDSQIKKAYGKFLGENIAYRAIYKMYINDYVFVEDREDMLPYGDRDFLIKKLKNRPYLKRQFRSNSTGRLEYYQAKWAKIETNGNITGIVLGFANISEQVRSKELLLEQKKAIEKQQIELDSAIEKAEDAQRISQIDRLTGLFNKISGQNLINDYLYSKKTTELYSLIFIDIDKFKNFNDKYGHLVGDDILELVGEAIRKNCRQNDIAVRFGGDEFVILLKNVKDSIPAIRKANCIQNELKEISVGKEYNLTCSIGVVTTETENLEEAVQKADDALYDVKESGRNNIKIYDK